ncbi:MAG TPA: uracil-DNA glycosylase [Armatimonadota bacterium]|jgi:DNA polymerase
MMTPPEPLRARAEALEHLAAQIRVCPRCDLALSRTHAVPGEGNPNAKIMFVGEAPGATEDKTGRPFVGPSGRFLDAMLADIGLQRTDIFIGNINRCRPPNNRDPNPAEIAACHPWMAAQLAIIQPHVVCTLGRFAMNTLIDPKIQISKVHGMPFEREGILYIPLFHPAAALHRESLRETLIADMRALRDLLVARGLWIG